MHYATLALATTLAASAAFSPAVPVVSRSHRAVPRAALSASDVSDPVVNGLAIAAVAGIFAYQQFQLSGPTVAAAGPNAVWSLPDDDDECYLLGESTDGHQPTVCTSMPVGHGECELDEDFSEYYETGIWRCDE